MHSIGRARQILEFEASLVSRLPGIHRETLSLKPPPQKKKPTFTKEKNLSSKADKMAQWIKVLAAKLTDLSHVPGIHIHGGSREDSQ